MHDAKNEPIDNNTKNNESDINLEQGNIKDPAAVAKKTNKLTLMDIALIEAKKAAVHRESLKNTKDVSLSSPNSDIQTDNTEKDPIPINKQSCPTTRQTMINLRAIRNVSEKYYNPPSIVEPPKMEEDVGRKKSISIEPSESFKEAEALLNCQILHKDILAEEEDKRKEALKKGLNPEHKVSFLELSYNPFFESPRFSRPSSSTKEGRLPISLTDCPPESPSMRTPDFPSLPPLFVINKEETRKTSAVLKEEELVGSGILHRDLQAEEDLIRQEAKRRAAGFGYQKEDVCDNKVKTVLQNNFKSHHNTATFEPQLNQEQQDEGWTLLYNEPNLKVLKRPKPGDSRQLYEYRCIGSYFDISAVDFIEAQFNVLYRKSWDLNVGSLEVLDEDKEERAAIIKWVAKFPFPMSARTYIYLRKVFINWDTQSLMVISKGLKPSEYPDDEKCLRISNYNSTMAVRAHKDFYSHGLDYVLTYCDDPEANIPSIAYNYIVNQGGPYFLRQVHTAAKNLEEKHRNQAFVSEFVGIRRDKDIITENGKDKQESSTNDSESNSEQDSNKKAKMSEVEIEDDVPYLSDDYDRY
uniref:START domain-containing protein n=1 Tax=Rhabditophanes sp. KR3021 TaxID=114890 RepID=A0AC35UC48_9BILA